LDSGLVLGGPVHYRLVCGFSKCAYSRSEAWNVVLQNIDRLLIGMGADCSLVSPCSTQNCWLFRLDRGVLFWRVAVQTTCSQVEVVPRVSSLEPSFSRLWVPSPSLLESFSLE